MSVRVFSLALIIYQSLDASVVMFDAGHVLHHYDGILAVQLLLP